MKNIGPGKFHLGMIGSMHAIEVAETGGPEVLTYVEKPQPSPGPGEVLIKAEAIGVNFIDTYFRSGQYPREVPFIVGTEVCGTVEAVGDDVAALQRRRPGGHRGGQWRLRRILRRPQPISCAYVPDGVGPDAAAAALLKGMTAHYLIKSDLSGAAGRHRAAARRRGRRRPDPDAVGHQHGRPGDHHRVDAARRPNCPARQARWRCSTIPTTPPEFGARIRELTDGDGVAAVYDGVGASTFDASLASLAIRGTLALFGASSGPVPPFDPQRLNAAGSVFLTRPDARALHPHTRRVRLACR